MKHLTLHRIALSLLLPSFAPHTAITISACKDALDWLFLPLGRSNTERLSPRFTTSVGSMIEAAGSLSYQNHIKWLQYTQGGELWKRTTPSHRVAVIHVVAIAIMPAHSPTGIYHQRAAPWSNFKSRSSMKLTPTPDVVDSEDSTAVPLQIPLLRPMATTEAIPAQR
jgi:hypothetical protein